MSDIKVYEVSVDGITDSIIQKKMYMGVLMAIDVKTNRKVEWEAFENAVKEFESIGRKVIMKEL